MNRFVLSVSSRILVMGLVMLASCRDLAVDYVGIDGKYTGTYAITNAKGLTNAGSVIFTFEGSRYSCEPQNLYLPPAGGGTFARNGQSLRLKDTMAHTKEFDWTLILNGDFTLIFDGSHLVLQQDDVPHQRHRVIDLTRQ
jgi:hypothetical protein